MESMDMEQRGNFNSLVKKLTREMRASPSAGCFAFRRASDGKHSSLNFLK